MSEETPEQVTLNDLPPIAYVRPVGPALWSACTRCGCPIYDNIQYGPVNGREVHERWHAAIEDAADPRLSTLRRATLDQFVAQAGATASAQTDQPHERLHQVVNKHGCQPGEDMIAWVDLQLTEYAELKERTRGLHRGEVERLRRIEDALTKAGAPNRSERGDPGGLVVRWIERQVALMAEYRRRDEAAARAVEALSDRPPREVYADAVEQIAELKKTLAAVPKSVREMHQDLLTALGLDKGTGFYAALDVVREYVAERSSTMTQAEANALVARAEAKLAEAETCPSLWLDTEASQLHACNAAPAGHDNEGNHYATLASGKNIYWDNRDAVPSPWPLDQEPPAGITCLRDGDDQQEMPYLLRAIGGWRWSEKQDGTGRISEYTRSWADAALSVEGDLVVVRP